MNKLIKRLIRKLKSEGLKSPYAIMINKDIDVSKFPEIEKVIINNQCADGMLYIYPC